MSAIDLQIQRNCITVCANKYVYVMYTNTTLKDKPGKGIPIGMDDHILTEEFATGIRLACILR